MKPVIVQHLNKTQLHIGYAGTSYRIQPAPKTVRRLCQRLKSAAGPTMFGRPTQGESNLIANENTDELIPRVLGDAHQVMISDGRTPEEVKAFSVMALHFHASGIAGAQRIAAQLNRLAVA